MYTVYETPVTQWSLQIKCKADPRFAPSQWETALLCNDVSHWLLITRFDGYQLPIQTSIKNKHNVVLFKLLLSSIFKQIVYQKVDLRYDVDIKWRPVK